MKDTSIDPTETATVYACAPDSAEAHRISIVLVEGASELSTGALLSPFRCLMQNQSIRNLEVSFFRLGDVPVLPGEIFRADETIDNFSQSLMRARRPEHVFIHAGQTVPKAHREALIRVIRLCSRSGVRLACFGEASYLAANIGLYADDDVAVHWQSATAISELEPQLSISNQIFSCGRWLSSCAGEAGTLDYVLHFIGETFGRQEQARICNQLLIEQPRPEGAIQPGDFANRARNLPPVLRSIIQEMADEVETPRPLPEYAEALGISHRHVERLFHKHLGMSPGKFRRNLQVETAYRLCYGTELPISEIALACGFSTASLLSKAFRARYGQSPAEFREEAQMTEYAFYMPTGSACNLNGSLIPPGFRPTTPLSEEGGG